AFVTGSTTVTAGQWHHLAAVYDGSTLKVYVDGVVDGSVAASVSPGDGSNSLKLGARGDDAALRLQGEIDEVAIYGHALTPEDIALRYHAGRPPGPPPVPDLTTADCTTHLQLEPGYVESVNAALRSKADVWGNELLARPEGPTYENIQGFLKPLRLVGQPAGTGGNQLTDSGVYYIPMGEPGGDFSGPVALHVADG